MRARRRRSVLNTISAAALEVAIMGIFVIIAQPQLRDALFEILQVDQTHPTTQVVSRPLATPSATTFDRTGLDRTGLDRSGLDRSGLDRTVQTVLNSPVGQAIENSLAPWTGGSSLRDQSAGHHVAGYSPFDQFESFRVNVAQSNPTANHQPQPNGYTDAPPYQPHSVPQYVPPQNYGAQNYAPTQLTANQWNIASANQSPRPNVNAHSNTNNWIPSQVTETSFRQVYPPPYGTQSMWK